MNEHEGVTLFMDVLSNHTCTEIINDKTIMNNDSAQIIKYMIWIVKPWGIKEFYSKCL